MSSGRLILVRHGESAGNVERIFADEPSGLPLTDRGYRQAEAVAERIGILFAPVLVVASPFLRAQETARIIAEHLRLPLAIEPQLRERDIGDYRGRSYDSLIDAEGFDAQHHWLWKPAGGESYTDVQARVGPILDRLAAQHPCEDVVVVSHGGVMLSLWAYVTGSWDAAHTAPNCGVVLVEHGPQGYSKPQVIGGGSAEHAGG